jgi:hypothetical protein
MNRVPVAVLVFALSVVAAAATAASRDAQQPKLGRGDRIRIAEGRRIADEIEAPFAILLVTKENEFLIYHPRPSDDFSTLGYDSLLQSDVYVRDRVYGYDLLATFPAVGGLTTIVIGQTKNTEASHSTRWVITLLHEHFHQWQVSQPDYYPSVDGLDLARGDSTGMWMLNYPFPYEDKAVDEAFDALCRRLHDAVAGMGTHKYQDLLEGYLAARKSFGNMLSDDDYAYFSLQVWQEGIARYTEYMLASKAEFTYRPTSDFENLPDYVPFGSDARATRDRILSQLQGMSLKKLGRAAFYYVGAAEGLLLDHENPGWRDRYFDEPFYVERYFGVEAGEDG